MNCWICDKPANGICRFCGRALCRDHHQTKAIFLTIYVADDGIPKVIAVGDALFCGRCNPHPTPLSMPELR